MNASENISLLGLGTNRFLINGANDATGIEQAADIVVRALEKGVRYIDAAPTYSRGMAHKVLKLAFAQTKYPFSVTLKSSFVVNKAVDDVRRNAETSLRSMGIDHATHFLAWSIMSFDEFRQIMKSGSLYDGARRLKDEGIIDRICFSTHAPASDIIKIIKSGAFEEVTISYSLLNSVVMQPVLDCALEQNIGVVVMNPLGGGVIPQNRDYFSFARNDGEDNTVHAALRYVAAHPAVKVVLSGISSLEQLDENLEAFKANSEPNDKRIARVNACMRSLNNFCTGCDYCKGCPKDIPISSIMQSRNTLLFNPVKAYRREDPDLLRNIQLLRKLDLDFAYYPETSENPCIRCGICEKKCTQSLKIVDSVEDTYNRISEAGYSISDRKKRLNDILYNKNYKKVGFFPSGGYCDRVIAFYRSTFGEPPFEILLFNSDPAQWGTVKGNLMIHSPQEILELMPDCIVISNYNFSDEIYESLKCYIKQGIEIVKLHEDNDAPWVF